MDERFQVQINGLNYAVIDSISNTVMAIFESKANAFEEAKRLNDKYGWGDCHDSHGSGPEGAD